MALNYGRPEQEYFVTLTVEEAEKYLKAGQFPRGSMGPKIEAATQFIRNGGNKAIIASIEDIKRTVSDTPGTIVTSTEYSLRVAERRD